MRLANVPDELDVTPIGDEQLVVIVADDHPLAGRKSIALRDLDGQRVVAPPTGSPLRGAFDEPFARARVVPNVVAEADHHEMLLELARAGVGLAVASATSATLVTGRGVAAIPVDPPVVQALALVVRRGHLTPAAAEFRDLAVKLLA
jgi:DNA-binding transcriptional LysR family regulator